MNESAMQEKISLSDNEVELLKAYRKDPERVGNLLNAFLAEKETSTEE